jgi:hypothetical protein
MAVTASQGLSVGTTAVQIAVNLHRGGSDTDIHSLVLKNMSGVITTVYLGPLGVTTANGFRWNQATDGPFSFDLEPREAMYAVVASGTQTLDLIGGGR